MTLELTLPWDQCYASTNERHRGDKPWSHTTRYTSALQFIRARAHNQVVGTGWSTEGAFEVECRMVPPDRRRRDPSNIVKLVLDALQGPVYEDDYQARDGGWSRGEPDPAEPRIEVTVRRLES